MSQIVKKYIIYKKYNNFNVYKFCQYMIDIINTPIAQ